MDIPETGAIFSLGKSHLIENNQSYFFVKNDPVKRLVSGPNQSAVICESGRLFVWGENQFGQLATEGASKGTELVTKPTCVKSLKVLGLKVLDVSFGLGWSVILTNSNEIYFSGRNIFPEATKVFQKFTPFEVGTEKYHVTRKAVALEEFRDAIKGEQFQRILAGNEHFAVSTSSGRLFAWGNNSLNQLGQPDTDIRHPIEIKVDDPIKSFVCGPKSTLILTEKDQLFIAGTLNDFKYPKVLEISLNFPKEEIIFMQVSHANEIYLVTEGGNIYKSSESARNNNLTFNKFYDYDQDENGAVEKLLKGSSFFGALTKTKKLYTTFSESGHHLKTFREISKFKNLKILDFAIGDKHVLVLGVPKTSRNLGSSCRSLNSTYALTPVKALAVTNGVSTFNGNVEEDDEDEEHEGFRDLTKSKEKSVGQDASITTAINDFNRNSMQINGKDVDELAKEIGLNQQKEVVINGLHEHDPNDEIDNKSPVLNLKSDVVVNTVLNGASKLNEQVNGTGRVPEDSNLEDNKNPPEILPDNQDLSKLIPLTPALKKSPRSRAGSGRSIKFDESSLQHHKSTERLNRPQTPYPDPNSSSPLVRKISVVGSEDDAESPALTDSLEHIPEDSPRTINTARRVSIKYSDRGLSSEKLNDIVRIISATTPGALDPRFVLIDDELEQDEQLEVEIETIVSAQGSSNDIRYINNGIDVTRKVKEIHEMESMEDKISENSMEIEQLEQSPGRKVSAKSTKRNTMEVLIENTTPINQPEEKIPGKSPKEKTPGKSPKQKTPANIQDRIASSQSSKQKMPEQSPGQKFTGKTDNILAEAPLLATIKDEKIIKDIKKATQTDIVILNEDEDQNKTESISKDDGKLKTSRGEDDERTTASVNSNIITSNFENDSEKDKDSINDIETLDPETKKEKVRRFLKDLKNKGREMSCKNDESILVEDEPPKYTPTATEQPADGGKTSKVCTIL